METTTRPAPPSCTTATIGPIGAASRVLVGAGFVAAALWWRDPTWVDAVVGLVAMPGLATVLLGWRARRRPGRLEAVSSTAHCLNMVLFLPLFFIPATAGGAFLFYGVSMWVAALRRTGGCEVTAIANTVFGRDDQVGCMLFDPIDAAEARRWLETRIVADHPRIDVKVLTVTDCPHRELTLHRVREALARVGSSQAAVTERVVDDPADAGATGMRGSPTVLIYGDDPFATAEAETSVSCRLYPTATGYEGAPGIDDLVAAFTHTTGTRR